MATTQNRKVDPKENLPNRSLTQRRAALEKANRVRRLRAELKSDLKSRRKSIHEILMDPPEWAESMKLIDALLACPNYGKIRANTIVTRCGISLSKTLGGMSPRQRKEVVSMIRK